HWLRKIPVHQALKCSNSPHRVLDTGPVGATASVVPAERTGQCLALCVQIRLCPRDTLRLSHRGGGVLVRQRPVCAVDALQALHIPVISRLENAQPRRVGFVPTASKLRRRNFEDFVFKAFKKASAAVLNSVLQPASFCRALLETGKTTRFKPAPVGPWV